MLLKRGVGTFTLGYHRKIRWEVGEKDEGCNCSIWLQIMNSLVPLLCDGELWSSKQGLCHVWVKLLLITTVLATSKSNMLLNMFVILPSSDKWIKAWAIDIWNYNKLRCFAIWYHLYNSKIMKNIHAPQSFFTFFFCNFTKSNTPPWVFFTFLKLYKW